MDPSHQEAVTHPPAPDRLMAAGRLMAALAVSCALAGIVLVMIPCLQSGAAAEKSASLLGGFHLSHLALHPGGHPMRAPESSRSAVDLRPSAWLPFPEPGGGLSLWMNSPDETPHLRVRP